MFEHNHAVGGAAINVDYYLAKLSNVSISNNRESALQVSLTINTCLLQSSVHALQVYM